MVRVPVEQFVELFKDMPCDFSDGDELLTEDPELLAIEAKLLEAIRRKTSGATEAEPEPDPEPRIFSIRSG